MISCRGCVKSSERFLPLARNFLANMHVLRLTHGLKGIPQDPFSLDKSQLSDRTAMDCPGNLTHDIGIVHDAIPGMAKLAIQIEIITEIFKVSN